MTILRMQALIRMMMPACLSTYEIILTHPVYEIILPMFKIKTLQFDFVVKRILIAGSTNILVTVHVS